MYFFLQKRLLASAVLLGSLLSACETITEVAPATSEQGHEPVVYTIRKGGHYSDKNSYRKVSTSRIKFEVTFNSTAVYTTVAANNQADINKLYGLSDCNSSHHTNSARFGWRWYNNRLELLAYTYLNQQWDYKVLGEVAIGKPLVCELRMEEGQYTFVLDGHEVVMPRACNGPGDGYQLYPYFGGDEVAPHDIQIEIKELD
ncbi:hypothetical protein [Pontibacter actiniarum]|uniref:Lipoprotein n=1 Tax=Pontibacter actiniarum TaxID=323450 RepID=A0A1X9YPS6_9BACT|nr:hypothetical protein [Pontibacter actiniarum]ARS34898.1 hypothetical protein CA264_05280 [Pontibacter actiniarum]